MTRKFANPNDLLVPDQLLGLNEHYYSARPWTYFQERLHLLALAAGAAEELRGVAADGLEIGRFGRGPVAKGPTDQDEEDREAFLIAESQVLLHHVSETVLRLYMAHETLSLCPWLEMTSVREPGKFKRIVNNRFFGSLTTAKRREKVGQVFFAAPRKAKTLPSAAVENWDASTDNIEAFLTHYARQFLDSDVYNCLKHGVAVRAGGMKMEVAIGDAKEILIGTDGPAIEYLTVTERDDGTARWRQTTQWTRLDRTLTFITIAADLIESMWSIARFRYLNQRPETMRTWEEPSYQQLADAFTPKHDGKIVAERMDAELLYYVPATKTK